MPIGHKSVRPLALAALTALATLVAEAATPGVRADDPDLAAPSPLGSVMPEVAPGAPRHHQRIARAATLEPDAAEAIYSDLVGEMAADYARSGLPAAREYRQWPRFNRAPYRSASHGRRFVNNYASDPRYGRFEKAGRFPVGTVVAKDSFTVTDDGHVEPGPLFLMTKMAEGFNAASGDWRYSVVMPSGEVAGVTRGENAAQVAYCIGCHLIREAYDHMYFPPPRFRVGD